MQSIVMQILIMPSNRLCFLSFTGQRPGVQEQAEMVKEISTEEGGSE